MQGLFSTSALLYPPEKAKVMQRLVILPPLIGTPENAGVMQQLRPLVGPQKVGVM